MIGKPVSKPSVTRSVNPRAESRLNIRQDKTIQDNTGFCSKNKNKNPYMPLESPPDKRDFFSWSFSLRGGFFESSGSPAKPLSPSFQQSYPQSPKESGACSTKTGSNSRLVLSATSGGRRTGTGPSSNTSSETRRRARLSAPCATANTSGAGGAASFVGCAPSASRPSRSGSDAGKGRSDRHRRTCRSAGHLRDVLVGDAAAGGHSAAACGHGDSGVVELMEAVG